MAAFGLFGLGTMLVGAIDACGGQCIKTRFLVVGVPVAPLDSWIITDEESKGFKLTRLQVRSVIAGYLRAPLGAGVALAIVDVVRGQRHLPIVALVGLVAGWIVSMLLFRTLPENLRSDRELLASVVGIAAPPELLEATLRSETIDRLKATLADTLRPDEASGLRIQFAIARYELDVARARVLFERIRSLPLAGSTEPSEQPQFEGMIEIPPPARGHYAAMALCLVEGNGTVTPMLPNGAPLPASNEAVLQASQSDSSSVEVRVCALKPEKEAMQVLGHFALHAFRPLRNAGEVRLRVFVNETGALRVEAKDIYSGVDMRVQLLGTHDGPLSLPIAFAGSEYR